jgi:small subunit ribosomal protein S1
VENPREVVSQGDHVNVRILEVDADRRRLSLSLKRVEDGMPVQPKPGEEGEPPALGLSDEVFADEVPAAESLEVPAEEPEPPAEPVAEAEVAEAEVAEEEPEPATQVEPEAEPEAEAEASDEAPAE